MRFVIFGIISLTRFARNSDETFIRLISAPFQFVRNCSYLKLSLIRVLEFFFSNPKPNSSLTFQMKLSCHEINPTFRLSQLISVPAPLEVINVTADESPANSQRTLVFVGVMTSKDFLESRAKAVYNTWGKLVPGRIAFFSSEGSSCDGKRSSIAINNSCVNNWP